MFGSLRLRRNMICENDMVQLRRHHCCLCHTLRHAYQTSAGLLAGREGRFLVLLTDAQTIAPARTANTRCPAKLWLDKLPMTISSAGSIYASAVSILILEQKLKDDISDDNSLSARLGTRCLGKYFAKAIDTLKTTSFPLQEIDRLQRHQFELENTSHPADLDLVTAPTASAVGILMSHTARLAGATQNIEILEYTGIHIGRLITLLDACHDYTGDWKRNRYNAIHRSFTSGRGSWQLSLDQFDHLKNYLLVQLNHIRTYVRQLSLRRHRAIIENILLLGLFDATSLALEMLSKSITNSLKGQTLRRTCHLCGITFATNFCQDCGTNRLFKASSGHARPGYTLPGFNTMT